MAVRTWHKVICGFFPPKPLGLADQEQVADLGHREVPQDGIVLANFKMTQTEFILFVLQRAFHRPTCEADVQDDFQRGTRTGVAKEVFFLFRIEDVAGVDEPVGAEDLAIATQPERSALDFPHRRTSLGILDVDTSPGLAHYDVRIAAEGFYIATRPRGCGTRLPASRLGRRFSIKARSAQWL